MQPTSQIEFAVRGNQLRVEYITSLLGLMPTSGFNPNETYIGSTKVGNEFIQVERRRPSYGVWHFSSEGQIASQQLQDHADFLLMQLEPARPQIEELLCSQDFKVSLIMWHVGPAGFEMTSKTFSRLAALSSDICITCFEVADKFEEVPLEE